MTDTPDLRAPAALTPEKIASTFVERMKTIRFLRKNLIGDGGLPPESPFALLLDAIEHDAAPLETAVRALLDEREADKARIAELEAALRGADELLGEAYEHWDADRDSQVGKILSAFAGHLPNYAPRATAFRAALSGARP